MVVVTTVVGVVFRLSSYFRNLSEMEKSCVVFMERSQECESVILIPDFDCLVTIDTDCTLSVAIF